MLDWIIGLDKELFLFLNGINSPLWDRIMWLISGKFTWIPLYVILLVGIIYSDLSARSIVITILFILVTVLLCDQISVLLKNFIGRLRPSHDPTLHNLVHIVNDYRGGKYGFVSSHAANVFGVAVFSTNQLKSGTWSFILIVWAIIVSYSRIYLGVHFPLDIIFGAILGTMIGIHMYVAKAWLLAYIDIQIKTRKNRQKRREI